MARLVGLLALALLAAQAAAAASVVRQWRHISFLEIEERLLGQCMAYNLVLIHN
jgi:hypothetical protein